jgi:hypothetical protein
MHRNIEIIVPAEHTDRVLERLQRIDAVLAISVMRGAAVKPPGDAIKLQSLNRNADEVLRCVQDLHGQTQVNIATSEISSLIDPRHADAINSDSDDSLWEEIEAGLRRTVHVDFNYLLLMALGGVIASCGLILEGPSQAIAFVAASIIAPAFEPIAKVPIALVLRNNAVLGRAIWSFSAGYLTLIVAAAATFLCLRFTGAASASALLRNKEVQALLDSGVPDFTVSAAGALAGIMIVVTYRDAVIAGPLIAMVLVPAAALLGVSVALLEPGLVAGAAMRFGIDMVFVFASGVSVVALKQWTVHRRRPMM